MILFFFALPLHIRRLISLYDVSFEDYVNIKYTCKRLKDRTYSYVPTDIVETMGLMRCVRYFFMKTDIPKYTPINVSHILMFYRSIKPWNTDIVDFYPWSLHVLVALLACGYVPTDTSDKNPIDWKFNIALRSRFEKVMGTSN